MRVRKAIRIGLATCVLLTAGAAMASAEIVFMTSGRTMSVKTHRNDGDSVILTLRSGGEVTCDQSLIEKILPDEVPYPEPQGPAKEPEPAKTAAANGSAQLRETIYSELISATAQTHGVDPILVQALIQVESNYQPRARSSKGAMGLMQLMPAVAREYNVRNAYDPKSNIDAGIRKLKSLLEKMGGDVALALAAYNAGDGAVAKFNGMPPYRETRNYVSRILAIAGLR